MTVLCRVLSILLMLGQAPTPAGSPVAGGLSSQPALPSASADVMTPKDPKERMELAEKVNGLHGMDIPWHLKASYEIFGVDGKSNDAGTYEEWRVNAKRYRLAFHGPSVSAEEYGTDNGVFATAIEGRPGRPLSAIKEMIARPISSPADSEKIALQNFERSFGAGKLPCTALMKHSANITAEDAKSFCFSSANAVLLYASTPNKMYQTLFEHIVLIHRHYLARDMQLFIEGRPWLKIHIDTVEALGPAGLSALTVPAEASPVTVRTDATADVITGHLIKKAYPVYPEKAKLQGVQGTVILDGVIGTDGHFKKLQVLAGPPMLQKAALDAAGQWVYTPYLVDGQPVEVETDINVVFSLSQ